MWISPFTVSTLNDQFAFNISSSTHRTYCNASTGTTLRVVVLPLTQSAWCSDTTCYTTHTPKNQELCK